MFIDEVMDLVELTGLKNAMVGIAGATGLSAEQRKRLTIAVELVASPSIIFMDEPTTGLDARAGVPRIKEGQNPAAWVLDISSHITEYVTGVDYAEIYRSSSLVSAGRTCF